MKKIEADRKQFEDLLNISVTDNYYRNRMQQDDAYRLDSTSNMPGGTPITANIPGGRPIGTANIPGGTPIGTANAPGGRGNFLDSDAYREMLLNIIKKEKWVQEICQEELIPWDYLFKEI